MSESTKENESKKTLSLAVLQRFSETKQDV